MCSRRCRGTWWHRLATTGRRGTILLIVTNANQAVGATNASPGAAIHEAGGQQPDRSGRVDCFEHPASRNSIGYSNYNATWACSGRTMSNGLQFNMNYEWAKSMDINSLGSQGGAVFFRTAPIPSKTMGCRTSTCAITLRERRSMTLPFKGNRLGVGLSAGEHLPIPDGQPGEHRGEQFEVSTATAALIRPKLVGPDHAAEAASAGTAPTSPCSKSPAWAMAALSAM